MAIATSVAFSVLVASPAYADYFGPYYTDGPRMDFHINSNVDSSSHVALRSVISGAMQKLDTQSGMYDVAAANVPGTEILFNGATRNLDNTPNAGLKIDGRLPLDFIDPNGGEKLHSEPRVGHDRICIRASVMGDDLDGC